MTARPGSYRKVLIKTNKSQVLTVPGDASEPLRAGPGARLSGLLPGTRQ